MTIDLGFATALAKELLQVPMVCDVSIVKTVGEEQEVLGFEIVVNDAVIHEAALDGIINVVKKYARLTYVIDGEGVHIYEIVCVKTE